MSVYEALPGRMPSLYEMGLPIVETGDKWHVDVGQKVPLNRDRNNVKPAYLRAVRTLVLNDMHDRLTEMMRTRCGSAKPVPIRPVRRKPSTGSGPSVWREAGRLRPNRSRGEQEMGSMGGTVVHGGMMNAQEWKNAKEAGAIEPAGRLCPTPKPYSDDPNAPPVTVVPESEWTEGMKNIVAYAKVLAKELMGVDLAVRVVDTTNNSLPATETGIWTSISMPLAREVVRSRRDRGSGRTPDPRIRPPVFRRPSFLGIP